MNRTLTAEDTYNALKRPFLDINNLNYNTIEVENVRMGDYPDFCDAFISYVEFKDGTPLDDDQIEQLNDDWPDIVYTAAYESRF